MRRSAQALVLCLTLISLPLARGVEHGTLSPETATTDQIIQRMTISNDKRSQRLRQYKEERHYQTEYRGFPHDIKASMDVEVTYSAPFSKSFHVRSQTGSKLIIDRVLMKLLTSEREAAENPSRTALSSANYIFTSVGNDIVAGRKCYVLHVEPRANGKFLYRGTICIDAEDYAVARIDAAPAKNPSFWIEKTEIHQIYTKTGEFWLPKQNRSETKVRIGGTAVLTIDYGNYDIEPSDLR